MSLIVLNRPTAVQNPLQASWQYTPLPDHATVDNTNGPAFITELVRQAGLQKPNLNVWNFTAEQYTVPADQPLIPVTCSSGDSHLNQAFAEGVPIPADAQPTNDSDATLLIYQPDSPHGGTYWELWKTANTNGTWACSFGGRMTGVNTRTTGHYVNWVNGPSGTYEAASWGVQGSGLPYWPGLITPADIQRGYCNHALLLEMVNGASGIHPWPAARSDGSMTTQPWTNVWEGARVRLAPNYPINPSWHPILQCIVRTDSMHGSFITDKTAYNLVRRATPSCGPYLNGTADYDILDGYPWQDLQLLTPGSDSNPVPTS